MCPHHSIRGIPKPRGSLTTRFWAKVRKTDGCWLWLASTVHGYGQLRIDSHRMEKAHHVSWELHYGPIANSLWILHSCDNPACVRPDHLFLGGPADNSRDMVNKGRSLIGLRNHKAKLTEVGVESIRTRHSHDYGTRLALAREFGVSPVTISSIVAGRTWKHLYHRDSRDCTSAVGKQR